MWTLRKEGTEREQVHLSAGFGDEYKSEVGGLSEIAGKCADIGKLYRGIGIADTDVGGEWGAVSGGWSYRGRKISGSKGGDPEADRGIGISDSEWR